MKMNAWRKEGVGKRGCQVKADQKEKGQSEVCISGKNKPHGNKTCGAKEIAGNESRKQKILSAETIIYKNKNKYYFNIQC